ncbi:hypothetical protein [Conexibacter sp. S30A1]|uniref:hypothetical protein n=1 Tax=Conexibacter sp. S30A1 TaxID=2937800 RepID=UPI00200FD47A|nr:hypothetical protein [Conexibacter sp. S30A1]
MILDSSGNLVESFDEERQARATLEQIVGEAPEAAEHLALVTYDEHGEPVGDAITFSTHAATR